MLPKRRCERMPDPDDEFYQFPGYITPPECKIFEVPNTNTNTHTITAPVLLNGIGTGFDYVDRVGRRIQMHYCQVLGYIIPADDDTLHNYIALRVIYDTQPNGALPAQTDILESPGATSFPVHWRAQRFHVLATKRLTMGKGWANALTTEGTIYTTSSPQALAFKLDVPLDLPTTYNGVGATIASIQTGALYFLPVSSVTSAAPTRYALTLWKSRLYYTDA